MKEVVILSKNEYEVLLINLHKIKFNIPYVVPCYCASEVEHAAKEMAKILEGEEE